MKHTGVTLLFLSLCSVAPAFSNTGNDSELPGATENKSELNQDEEAWVDFIADLVDESIKDDVSSDRVSDKRLDFKVVVTMFVEMLKSSFSEAEIKKKSAELSKHIREAIVKAKKSYVIRSKELPAFYGCIATYKDMPRKDFEVMLRHLGGCVNKSFDFKHLAQTTLLLLQTAENLKATIRAKIEELSAG